MNAKLPGSKTVLAAIFAIGLVSSAAGAFADEVKSLRGKPSSSQILEALSPGKAVHGMRTRGLSLGSGEAVAEQAKAAPVEAGPRALDLDIKFEFNSGLLSQDGKDVLDQLAEALKSDALSGAKSIVLEGHADAKGNPAYNKVLSLRRAQSARNYLAGKHGIPYKKVQALGKGSSEPVDPNNPEDEVNRRVRVIVNG
jgi:OmpA-OmpF porin, OOP family